MPKRSLCALFIVSFLTTPLFAEDEAPTTKPMPAADEVVARSDDALPESLQKYHDIIERCGKFQRAVTHTSWQQVFAEDFSPKENPQWSLVISDDPKYTQASDDDKKSWTRLEQLDDREVVVVAPPWSQTKLAIGPKVKGDYAIEFVGKNMPGSLCELSALCGTETGDAGTGFRFGPNKNTNNRLRVGRLGNGETDVKLPGTPLQTIDAWHRVRLEVKDGVVAGYVDGAFIGKAAIHDDYDVDAEWQPFIYACCNKIAVDEASVWTLKTDLAEVDRDKVWNETMGDTSADDLDKALAELAHLLEDGDEGVRNGAATLLRQAREAAVPALKSAATIDGTFDPASVAGRLLRSIGQRYSVELPAGPAKE